MTEALANRVDPKVVTSLALNDAAGGLKFENASQAMELAELMAVGGVAVPKHLRGTPGACLAVVIQAIEWKISPFALANKSYSVNDRLAYESSVFQAVIQSRSPIKGRIKTSYAGAGDTRTCKVWAETKEGETVEYVSPQLGKIQPKNSPLWRNDPDQQLHYFSVRSWCRRHFPDVIMGVYAEDEIAVTPVGGSTPTTVTPVAAYDVIDVDFTDPTPGDSTAVITNAAGKGSEAQSASPAQTMGAQASGAVDVPPAALSAQTSATVQAGEAVSQPSESQSATVEESVTAPPARPSKAEAKEKAAAFVRMMDEEKIMEYCMNCAATDDKKVRAAYAGTKQVLKLGTRAVHQLMPAEREQLARGIYFYLMEPV